MASHHQQEDVMPVPLEICLEDLDLSPDDERYIHCVALPGDEPGLALDHAGEVHWMPDEPVDFGLWISADDRLVLLRGAGAKPITVLRGGRSVEAPEDKPVVLLDGDQLHVGGRRLQLHVHGATDDVCPPERFTGGALAKMAKAAATAALALGTMVGAGGEVAARPTSAATQPIEVRRAPPKPMPRRYHKVECTVTSIKSDKNHKTFVRARCPEPIAVGTRGYLLDAKGKRMSRGYLVVRSAKGKTIKAEARRLRKAIKATKAEFRVYE
jgi:hypothetical protein